MHKEFAVDPRIIASSFDTCRYLISQFGADKGRLISRFPKTWKKLAIAATDHLPDGFKKERTVEYLVGISNEWLTLVASNRAYVNPADDWLDNARAAQADKPFAAIICDHDEPESQLIDANTCDDTNPLFAVDRTCSVNRNAHDLAQATTLALQNCRSLRLIDPYFDPSRPKWRNPLAAILGLIPNASNVRCEYHLLERDDSPATEEMIQRLRQLVGVIPQGGVVHFVRWRQKQEGERFHRRYLLTENAGFLYEGGLDESTDEGQTTDVSLLDRNHHAERWAEYNLDAQAYELVEPVLCIDAAGNVTEIEARAR